MTAITPEQFMTLTEPDEAEVVDPLTYITAALMRIEDQIRYSVDEQADVHGIGEVAAAAREAYDDLEAKHAELYALLEAIEAIIKPSTSKLANSVRDAINAWRAPEVPIEDLAEPPVEGVGDHPSHDAPVEEWREYARTVHGVDEGTALDTMNRSQIRTLLGIDQPA